MECGELGFGLIIYMQSLKERDEVEILLLYYRTWRYLGPIKCC